MRKLLLLFYSGIALFVCFGSAFGQVDDSGYNKLKNAPLSLDELPPLTNYEKTVSVALDDSAAMILFESGYKQDSWTESRFTVIRRIKIFAIEGEKYGTIQFQVKPYEYLESLEGRTILPDGTVVPLDAETMEEIGVTYANIWGPEYIYRYHLPQITKGAIVEYSYTISTSLGSGLRFNSWYLQDWIFTIYSLYTLDTPVDFMPVKADVENISASALPDIEETEERKKVTYRFADIPALRAEPLMPPSTYLLSRLIVDYEWTRSKTSEPIEFWMQVGRSQALRVNRFIADRDAIAQLARELTTDEMAMEEKVVAIVTWIQDNVTYLSSLIEEELLEEGELLFEDNQSAAEVLANRYGTSLEITQLAIALMREAGIEAFLALAVSRSYGVLRYTFLDSHQFDQAFIAIRLPGNEALFVHPAARNGPALTIPWHMQGSLALVCTQYGSVFARLPVDSAEQNLQQHELDVTMRPNGTAAGTLKSTYTGQENMIVKNRLLKMTADQRKQYLMNEVLLRYNYADVKSVEITGLLEYGPNLQIKMEVVLPRYIAFEQSRRIFRPGFMARFPDVDVSEAKRELPIYLPYPVVQEVTEIIRFQEQVRISLPGGQNIQSEVGKLSIEWLPKERMLHWKRRLVHDRIFFDPSEARLLQSFLEQVRQVDSKQLSRVFR